MLPMAGYIRVSRVAGREGDSFISPQVQRERIEAWARSQGAEIDWYEELDASGGDRSRAQWQAALESCERGETGGVVVAKLDRFARSAKDAFEAFERLEDAGARFVSVEDGFDDSTHMGKFARGILTLLAQLERTRLTESWDTAARRAVDDGVHVAPTPFGYQRKARRVPLEVDPKEGPLVAKAFQARINGDSWLDIARLLGMSKSGALSLLRNTVYLGWAKGPNGAINKGAHPALVTQEMFDAVQPHEPIAPRDGSIAKHARLKGLCKCASCGSTMSIVGNGKKGNVSYYCRKHSAKGECQDPAVVSAKRVEDFVDNQLEMAVVDPKHPGHQYVVAILEDREAHNRAAEELAEAESELEAFVTKASALDGALFEKGLDARTYRRDAARREERKARPTSASLSDRKISYDEYMLLEDRARFRRFVDAVVVERADPKRRRWQPVEQRVKVVWRGE